MATNKKKILIVDSLPANLEGVSIWLSQCKDFDVVGRAHTLDEASQIIINKYPNLLLIDYQLPDGQCFSQIDHWLRYCPDLLIMIYGCHDELLVTQRCFMAGAHGYLRKTAPQETFVSAIRYLRNNGIYASERVKQQPVMPVLSHTAISARLNSLTRRQSMVLQLIGEGLSRQQIANQLGISAKTIDAHKTNIRERLGISSSIALTHHAIQSH